MELNNVNSSWKHLDYYLLTDQPTTCGIFGARTSVEEINSEVQIHECLNLVCGYKFITEE